MNHPTLKPGWKTYRFDQIAINVNERVMPDETDHDRYVGLEHLDPESLKIRRWGSPSDVIGQKLGFRKGDIIFGRRRAYQRKLAIADFDGICSAHAMVLRPKTDVVLPEFLPFFMQSDRFMNRAIEISVGSLSPTINWRTLAQEEFPLPPLEKQGKYCQIFKVVENQANALISAISASDNLHKSMCYKIQKQPSEGKKYPISKLLIFNQSGFWGVDEGKDDVDVRVFRSTDFSNSGSINREGGVVRSIPHTKLAKIALKNGDIILEKSGGGPQQPVGRVGFIDFVKKDSQPIICGNFMQALRPNLKIVYPEWLFWTLYGLYVSNRTLKYQTKTTGIRNIQLSDYLSETIVVPSIKNQAEVSQKIREIYNARIKLEDRLRYCKNIKNAFLKKFDY